MKKIFSLLSLCVLALTATAQDYVFTDKDGNVIPDGATIVCSEIEDDGFGGIIVPSGLFVKNVNAAGNMSVGIEANITRIDNGSLQLCFPLNCLMWSNVGIYQPEGKATLAQGEAKDIMTEWLPEAYGECIVTYKAKTYRGVLPGGDSYAVTVHYKYADPASVSEGLYQDTFATVCFYDLTGRKADVRLGLAIQRMSNGTVRKVIRR